MSYPSSMRRDHATGAYLHRVGDCWLPAGDAQELAAEKAERRAAVRRLQLELAPHNAFAAEEFREPSRTTLVNPSLQDGGAR